MIKLKLTKDQLFVLCGFCNPQKFENEAVKLFRCKEFYAASIAFDLLGIGDRAAKIYLFPAASGNYRIKISWAEGCSLLSHLLQLQNNWPLTDFKLHVLNILKIEISYQLTNYKKRYQQFNNSLIQ